LRELNAYPEAVRNRLLRRADWRFLLADPEPANSICFAGGLLADAVRLVSENTVHGAEYGEDCDGCFDLAVVSDPSTVTLQTAWRALRPGGALYGEWNNPLAASRARVMRQLETIGFTAPACYWPSSPPEREAAGAWLPLAARGALRYYAHSRNIANGGAYKAVQHTKWSLWQAIARLGVAMPLCGVAYKPIQGTEPVDTLQRLRQEWQTLDLGALPTQLHWLLLTGGVRSINKAVGLVFAEDEREPRLAVKMARVPDSLPALAHEATVLRTVHEQPRGHMAGVPEVLFSSSDARLGETALTGTPVWTQLSRSNFADLAMRATRWQVELAGDTTRVARAAWWDRLVASRVAWFGDAYQSAVDGQQLRRTAQLLETLPDLPLVCEQRDFSPWNVLLNGQDLVVLDWEGAELHGLPMLDLVYFLTYLALFVERVPVHGTIDVEQVRRVYRATLDPHYELGNVVQSCLAEYARRLQLPTGLVQPLRLLTWIVHAHAEYKAMWAEHGDAPDADRLRTGVFLHLWEEELASGGNRR
jgi:hypothetical protein